MVFVLTGTVETANVPEIDPAGTVTEPGIGLVAEPPPVTINATIASAAVALDKLTLPVTPDGATTEPGLKVNALGTFGTGFHVYVNGFCQIVCLLQDEPG